MHIPDNDLANAIRRHAEAQEDAAFDSFLQMLAFPMPFSTTDGLSISESLIAQHLIQKEERIILSKLDNRPDDANHWVEKYRDERRRAEEALEGRFEEFYRQVKAKHNECARANLDNSDGHIYQIVLPDFNSDGTHGKIGPRDYPWSRYTSVDSNLVS